MPKSIPSAEARRIRIRRREAEERQRHDDETSLAAAVRRACPDLTWGQALAEASRILRERAGALVLGLSLVLGACEPDPTAGCCAVCETGQPCGDACIESADVCTEGAGCACDVDGVRGVDETPPEPPCVSGGRSPAEGEFCCGEITVLIYPGDQYVTLCR